MRFLAHNVRLLAICLFSAGITSCNFGNQSNQHAESNSVLPESAFTHQPLEWPHRLSPDLPDYQREKGTAPQPLGTYGQCQILALSPGATDPLLLMASRTQARVRSSGKNIDINLTVDDQNESRFITGHHRLTIVELQPARARPTRGTVVYLGSITGISRPEQKLITALRSDGWHVISCLPPFESSYQEADLPIYGAEDLPNAAKRFAKRIENHLSERAYVAEAALAYVRHHYPAWLQGSTMIVGSSAGALALPAVLARIGPVDAAVLIGGGANVPGTMLKSSLELVKPVIKNQQKPKAGKKLNQEQIQQFETLAFQQMKFDPAYLAPLLDNTPTLLLLGTKDKIVPAANGSLLHQKLSKAQRWQYPVGHLLLMAGIPTKAEAITNWIRERCSTAAIHSSAIDYQKRKKVRVRITDNTDPKTKSKSRTRHRR